MWFKKKESQLKVLVHNKSAWVHWWMIHELSPGGLLVWNIDVKLEALNADTPPAEHFQFNMSTISL